MNKKERIEKLIRKRKNNIKLYESILQGKVHKYKKYMNDNTFITDVTNRLKIESELLEDLYEETLNLYVIYYKDKSRKDRKEYYISANNIKEALGVFFMENEYLSYKNVIDHMEV